MRLLATTPAFLIVLAGCLGDQMAIRSDPEVVAPEVYRAVLIAIAQHPGSAGPPFLVHPGVRKPDAPGAPYLWHEAAFYEAHSGDAIRQAVEKVDDFEICGTVADDPCYPGDGEELVTFGPIEWGPRGTASLHLAISDQWGYRVLRGEAVSADGVWRVNRLGALYFAN